MTTQTNKSTVRKPWVAGILSAIHPGLGQIYCGGIVFYLWLNLFNFLLSVLMIWLCLYQKAYWFLWVSLVISVLIYIAVIVDAVRRAKRKDHNYKLKDYNRWYIYILIFMCSNLAGQFLTKAVKADYIEAFKISTAGCYPTILPGDRFLVSKIAYKKQDPQRGEIIVFRSPDDRHIFFVQRVIAVAGDTIEIKDNIVYVNDQELDRERIPQYERDNIRIDIDQRPLEGDLYYEINGVAKYKIFFTKPPFDQAPRDLAKTTVPANHCFVMGDNRNFSHDSRMFGTIPLATVIGRADYLYWPSKDRSRLGVIE